MRFRTDVSQFVGRFGSIAKLKPALRRSEVDGVRMFERFHSSDSKRTTFTRCLQTQSTWIQRFDLGVDGDCVLDEGLDCVPYFLVCTTDSASPSHVFRHCGLPGG